MGSIPGSRSSSGGGNGTSLQYSCLGKFQGQRSLVGYSPWGCKESDTTERLSTHAHTHVTLDDQDSFSPLGNTVSLGRHVQV